MGKVLLGVGRYAKTPYYFKKLGLNIWSVEELCYFFKANPFVLDREIMDKKLVGWLAEECELAELSQELSALFRKGNSVNEFIILILAYVNYCTTAEQQQIADILTNSGALSDYEKQKQRADYLVKNKKYIMALQEYHSLLEILPPGEVMIGADIYHNMGVAYAGLFLFQNAAESFEKAYLTGGNEVSGQQFLAARRHQLADGEYIKFIAERPQYHELSLQVEVLVEQARVSFAETEESRMLFALKMYKEEGNVNSYYEEIDKAACGIKLRYQENVTN